MSSFQDTFTKQENTDDLQYDEFAFSFFSTTLLLIGIVLLIVHVVRRLKKIKVINEKRIPTCSCYYCEKKLLEIKKRRNYPTSLVLEIVLIFILGFLLTQSVQKCMESNKFKTFDAYEILGVEIGATDKDIKRSFLDMAKKFHPDRNPGDPDANKKFMLINKAYQCLKTEEARLNCVDHGNPEGTKGSFEVGIALPPFLLKRENKLVILALFFIFILIVLPVAVMYFYTSSEQLDAYGTKRSIFYNILSLFKNENIQFKNFLGFISVSEEMIPILKVKREQTQDLLKLIDKDVLPQAGLDKFRPFLKPFYILNATMSQRPIPLSLTEDLLFIQKNTVKILNSLIDISIELYNSDPRFIQQVLGQEIKFETISRLIFFSQHFYQNLVLHDPSVLQLPGIDKNNIEHFKNKFKKKTSVRFFMDKEENQENRQKLFAYFNNDEKQIDQINKVLECLPDIQLTASKYVKVNDSDLDLDIHLGDLYTVEVEIKKLNKKNGYIHSKFFPFLKLDSLFLIVLENKSKKIIYYKRILNNQSVFKETFNIFAQTQGMVNLKILVKSDSYLDVDAEIDFEYSVLSQRKKEEFVIHPEDEKALREESLFASMMNELQKENSDNEEEEDDEKENDKTETIKETK